MSRRTFGLQNNGTQLDTGWRPRFVEPMPSTVVTKVPSTEQILQSIRLELEQHASRQVAPVKDGSKTYWLGSITGGDYSDIDGGTMWRLRSSALHVNNNKKKLTGRGTHSQICELQPMAMKRKAVSSLRNELEQKEEGATVMQSHAGTLRP